MKAAVTYNRTSGGLPAMVEALVESLGRLLGKAEAVEADVDAPARLLALSPDVVLNMATGARGEAAPAHMPALLEMLALPYTGPGPLTAALCSDTARARESLNHYGIPAPAFVVAAGPEVDVESCFTFPVVVRPWGVAVSGVNPVVVDDTEGLARTLADPALSGGAIVEEYLPGREFSVVLAPESDGALGPLPVIEIDLTDADTAGTGRYGGVLGAGGDGCAGPVRLVCPADMTSSAAAALRKAAVDAATALGARDLCRVDVRFDAARVPRVLDVDPLPWAGSDALQDSPVLIAAGEAGMDLDGLVRAVVGSALKRNGTGVGLAGLAENSA